MTHSELCLTTLFTLALTGPALHGDDTPSPESETPYELTEFVIKDQQMANLRPVSTYESPISNLDFEPRVDLQARSMAEAQGDVTVRGGIFENTGFRIGSATLIDPQTGHYFAELPIAPEMLEGPTVLTGTENALYGFNSTVGTLGYDWSRVVDGGSATVGFGDHDLNFHRIHQGLTGGLDEDSDWTWGLEVDLSRSESEGTKSYSDHDFFRTTGRVQLLGPNSQTDLFAGYQSKFFGQFGMYTGEAFLAFDPFETENLKTRLFMLNHHQDYATDSYFEATAYTRRHSDHYIFNRFNPNNDFIHETQVHSLGLSGRHALDRSAFALNYAAQFATDEIESTTLENNFTSRDSFKLTLLPEYQLPLNAQDTITVRAGGSYDESNRDGSELSALFDVSWQRQNANGNSEKVFIAYSETSQVVGYTAIGGATGGLFASDPDLGRETSQNIEIGVHLDRSQWTLEATGFYRRDRDLVDWTFEAASPNARTANNVDIDTFGLELILARQWQSLEAIASYTYLHKDEDFGDPAVVGSFYALNYPEHRATLGLIWKPANFLELRLDNEFRAQEANPLRSGPEEAAYTHLGISFFPSHIDGLELFAAWDKPWDESFQEIPGTPGRGDQFSAGATYSW